MWHPMEGGRGMTPDQVANLTPGQVEFLLTPPKKIMWREGGGERAKKWLAERRGNWTGGEAAKQAKARHNLRQLEREREERRAKESGQ
jgi:hypothetical protein